MPHEMSMRKANKRSFHAKKEEKVAQFVLKKSSHWFSHVATSFVWFFLLFQENFVTEMSSYSKCNIKEVNWIFSEAQKTKFDININNININKAQNFVFPIFISI